jgi:hypothetical protein
MPDEQPRLLDLEEKPAPTVEGLWDAANAANVALEEAELEYLKEEDWLRNQRWLIERNETNMMIRVSAEKVDPSDPNSKNVYTNDTQRKAEVFERLRRDPAHRELQAALNVAENAQAIRKIHIDKLGRDYSLAKLKFEALTIGKRYEH